MKIKSLLFTVLAMCITSATQLQAQTTPTGKKILIAYFSWGGNTRAMAEQIKQATNADIFEIVPVAAYPKDYNACVEQAKKEINANHKPALKAKVADFASYDIIIVGSPNWWGTIAPPVATFLSSYDFSGKTILPFITHEGSRMGRSVDDIKKLCPKATILNGLPVRGSSVKNAGSDIQKWLKENSISK